jgi:uncharacterized membrane protein (UPF0127 family)
LRSVACLAVLLAALAAPVTATRAQDEPLQELSSFPRTTLTIHSGSVTHTFDVWVADSEPRQRQGLMFVRELDAHQGMLFTGCCSGIWMRNTFIELDILFVDADSRIVKIAERARPHDETTIAAGGPVADVIELKGGEAARLQLKTGDRVSWTPPKPAATG